MEFKSSKLLSSLSLFKNLSSTFSIGILNRAFCFSNNKKQNLKEKLIMDKVIVFLHTFEMIHTIKVIINLLLPFSTNSIIIFYLLFLNKWNLIVFFIAINLYFFVKLFFSYIFINKFSLKYLDIFVIITCWFSFVLPMPIQSKFED